MSLCKICKTPIDSNPLFYREADPHYGTFSTQRVRFDFFLCPTCGVCFSNALDSYSPQQLDDWYHYPEYLRFDDQGDSEYRKIRVLKQISFIENMSGRKPRRLLLSGAGSINLESWLTHLGFDVWSTFSMAEGSNKYNAPASKLPKNYFDLVVANEVVEHWIDPMTELILLWQVLDSKGFFMGTTGFTSAFIRNNPGMPLNRWGYLDQRCINAGHVLLWSERAAEIACNACGLKDMSFMGPSNLRKDMHLGKSAGFFFCQK